MDPQSEADLIEWLARPAALKVGLGVFMPSGFEAFASIKNGRQVLSSGGVVDQVRGGLAAETLLRFATAIDLDTSFPLYAGVWSGWGHLKLPMDARVVELPNRPTFIAQVTWTQCLRGFSADPSWYLPATMLFPIDRRWLIAGDIDSTNSIIGGAGLLIESIISNSLIDAALFYEDE